MGIRGTTGVIDVPPNAPTNVKLYQDENGTVGRIEIFGRDGARVGELTQAATGYAIQLVGQRLIATAITISAEQLLRDRNLVQRLFSFQNIGRQLNLRRLNLRNLAPGNLNPRDLDPRNLPRQQLPSIPGIPGYREYPAWAAERPPSSAHTRGLYSDRDVVDQPGLAKSCRNQEPDRSFVPRRDRRRASAWRAST